MVDRVCQIGVSSTWCLVFSYESDRASHYHERNAYIEKCSSILPTFSAAYLKYYATLIPNESPPKTWVVVAIVKGFTSFFFTTLKLLAVVYLNACRFLRFIQVFVLDDGGETDLDLGNYERFMGVNLRNESNLTTG